MPFPLDHSELHPREALARRHATALRVDHRVRVERMWDEIERARYLRAVSRHLRETSREHFERGPGWAIGRRS